MLDSDTIQFTLRIYLNFGNCSEVRIQNKSVVTSRALNFGIVNLV